MSEDYARGGIIPTGTRPLLSRGCDFVITRAQLETLGPNALLDELNRRDDEERKP